MWMQREKSRYVYHWDFFQVLLVGMGFEHWEVGFGKNMGWEMGLDPPPLQDPLSLLITQVAPKRPLEFIEQGFKVKDISRPLIVRTNMPSTPRIPSEYTYELAL